MPSTLLQVANQELGVCCSAMWGTAVWPQQRAGNAQVCPHYGQASKKHPRLTWHQLHAFPEREERATRRHLRCQPSHPARSSRTGMSPRFCVAIIHLQTTSCSLLTPRSNSTGQKNRPRAPLLFVLLPGGKNLAVPAPRCAPISQHSLARPSAKPRRRSQGFAKP